jgi:hypothetical protein
MPRSMNNLEALSDGQHFPIGQRLGQWQPGPVARGCM